MAEFKIANEVKIADGDWSLCFQWGYYHYDGPDERPESGYRFIWRDADGALQPARGQARIPSAAHLLELLSRATAAGWFVRVEEQRVG